MLDKNVGTIRKSEKGNGSKTLRNEATTFNDDELYWYLCFVFVVFKINDLICFDYEKKKRNDDIV